MDADALTQQRRISHLYTLHHELFHSANNRVNIVTLDVPEGPNIAFYRTYDARGLVVRCGIVMDRAKFASTFERWPSETALLIDIFCRIYNNIRRAHQFKQDFRRCIASPLNAGAWRYGDRLMADDSARERSTWHGAPAHKHMPTSTRIERKSAH